MKVKIVPLVVIETEKFMMARPVGAADCVEANELMAQGWTIHTIVTHRTHPKDRADFTAVLAVMVADTHTIKLANRLIKSLRLSCRAENSLVNNATIDGVYLVTLRDVCLKTEAEILEHRNFGKKSLNELKEKLSELGLTLGMTEEQLDRL